MTDGKPSRAEGTAAAQVDLREWELAEQERLSLELLQVRYEGMLVASAMVVLGAVVLTIGSVLALAGQWSYGGRPELAGGGLVAGSYGLVAWVPLCLMAFRGYQTCMAQVGRLTAAMDEARGEASRSRVPEHGRAHPVAGPAT